MFLANTGILGEFFFLYDYDKTWFVFLFHRTHANCISSNCSSKAKPVTKYDNWMRDSVVQLFAHNHMAREAALLDPYRRKPGTGVCGRMLDVLKRNGYQTSANSVDANSKMLTGDSLYANVSLVEI